MNKSEAFQALIQQMTIITGPTVAELFKQLPDAVKSPFTSFFASVVATIFTILGQLEFLKYFEKQ